MSHNLAGVGYLEQAALKTMYDYAKFDDED